MKYFNIIISCILLTSCKYQLKEEIKEWNPYTIGEVLVFESSTKQTDSFLISGTEHYFKENNEVFEVKYNFMGKIIDEKKKSEPKDPFLLSLTLRQDSVVIIGINLINRDESRTRLFERRISWLDSLVPASLYNHNKVLTIKTDNFTNDENIKPRDSTLINTIFWSKSEGLIGYKTEDEKQLWILKKKYSN